MKCYIYISSNVQILKDCTRDFIIKDVSLKAKMIMHEIIVKCKLNKPPKNVHVYEWVGVVDKGSLIVYMTKNDDIMKYDL